MRLLDVHNEVFQTFLGDDVPNYSIASHRWVQDECSIKDIVKRRNLESHGYKKVHGFCAFARQANELYKDTHPELVCDYVWIDTCCIDQKSSLEVDTAIRSMFQWYNKSVVCYAYLADVEPMSTGREAVEASLKQSVWFGRGWTLQELLAPRTVVFLTRDWEVIGHKCTSTAITNGGQCPGAGPRLNGMISEITGIPELVLYDYPRSKELSIEERMSWSAKRKTTRQEDMVYCLLGIFEIHMPVMYGEGDFAQTRLRNEIEKKTEAWQRGQKGIVQTRYNTRAPCASSTTGQSPLSTVSQSPPRRLPPPVPLDSVPNVHSVEASQDIGFESSHGPRVPQPQNGEFYSHVEITQGRHNRLGADELLDRVDDLDDPAPQTRSDASPAPSHTRPIEFGPPVRNLTFNNLREPYARHESVSPAVRTSTWSAGIGHRIDEEDEDGAGQTSHDQVYPLELSSRPSAVAATTLPSPPSREQAREPSLQASFRSQGHSFPSGHAGSDTDVQPPPPPSYDSIWESSKEHIPPHTDTISVPTEISTWHESGRNPSGRAPARSATWNTGKAIATGISRSPTWSSPSSDYPVPTLDDMRAPTRQATAPFVSESTLDDVNLHLSRKAQKKLESTIAKEERRAKRRERVFNRKHGNESTSTRTGPQGSASPVDDLSDSEEDDILSTTETNTTNATDLRSYSSRETAFAAAPQHSIPSNNPRTSDAEQDTRRQDARRRFLENAVIDGESRYGNPSTDTNRPPPPSRTRTNERSLSDIADALPSGLKLTKSALRLLDTRTGSGTPSRNTATRPDISLDQRTAIESESGTARSKPMSKKELKEVLKSQRGTNGQDDDSRRLGPRDRLLNAVSSHLRNVGN